MVAPAKRERSRALDVFRGATVAGMILVNYAGPLAGAPAPLKHSAWNGCTPTDLVFPSFLFIVGVAMWFAFAPFEYRLTRDLAHKVARRTLMLFAVGVGINAFPFVGVDWHVVTAMGVLQRIALCYGLGAIACTVLSARGVVVLCAALLLGYWALLAFGAPGAPYSIDGSLPPVIDRAVFGASHLNPDYSPAFEPEGLLGTIPSLVNVLAGFLAGRTLARTPDRRRATVQLALAGVVAIAVGLAWGHVLPINKPLWTSSFAVYTIGLTLVLLAASIYIVDVRGWQRPLAPLLAFGISPLAIYVVATLCKGALTYLEIGGRTIYASMYAGLVPVLGLGVGAVVLALGWDALFGVLAWQLARRKLARRAA
jgi:predicted acyltransferase